MGACPHCGEALDAPIAAHGTHAVAMHSHRDCPRCDRPLTYFTEGALAGAWRPDEAEERRRRFDAKEQ